MTRVRWQRASRGFTLVEVIVSLAILSVVVLAVATVFGAIGDTVTTGQRLSEVTKRSADLERTLRADFERMLGPGEGFMVIRNEVAQQSWDGEIGPLASDYVELYPGEIDERPFGLLFPPDPGLPRQRRIDELMFFVEGELRSLRQTVHPAITAEASAGRVYYGHGQKLPAPTELLAIDATVADRARRPVLNENMILRRNGVPQGPSSTVRLGEARFESSIPNPNGTASDWALLRQVTLLVPSDRQRRQYPDNIINIGDGGGIPLNELEETDRRRRLVEDHSRQVGLQPAAQSVFRSVIALEPGLPGEGVGEGGFPRGIRPPLTGERGSPRAVYEGRVTLEGGTVPGETELSPTFLSGIVDVAVGSMSEIRATVTTPRFDTGFGFLAMVAPSVLPSSALDGLAIGLATDLVTFENFQQGLSPGGTLAPTRGYGGFGLGDAVLRQDQVQQQWMLDALPSVPFDPDPNGDARLETGLRIRFDDSPVAGGTLYEDLQFVNREEASIEAIEQADQEMLRASVLLQGCSEFIVEFSYGVIDNDPLSPGFGRPIWHGLRRWVDGEDRPNGQYDGRGSADLLVADRLDFTDSGSLGSMMLYDGEEIAELGLSGTPDQPLFLVPDGVSVVPAPVVSGEAIRYMDPRIEALSLVRATTVDPPNGANGLYPPEGPIAEYVFGYADVDPVTTEARPWPWPRLVRVTARVADEDDPRIESSFQATFRIAD